MSEAPTTPLPLASLARSFTTALVVVVVFAVTGLVLLRPASASPRRSHADIPAPALAEGVERPAP